MTDETNAYKCETALCFSAREMLLAEKYIMIPAVIARFPKPKESVLVSEACRIPVSDVQIIYKFRYQNPFLMIRSGIRCFFALFAAEEPIEKRIRGRLAAADLSAVVFDFTKQKMPITENMLRCVLFSDCNEHKRWLYNAAANQVFHKFYRNAEKLRIVAIGMKEYVVGCPQKCHFVRGRYYASPEEDCRDCPFALSYYDEEHFWCTGKAGIAYKSDFTKTEEERIVMAQMRIRHRQAQKEREHCPKCGGSLTDCASNIGIVRRCADYPACNYVKDDPLFFVMRNREY